MIRRIVDSVSLLVDSGSQHSPERQKSILPDTSLSNAQVSDSDSPHESFEHLQCNSTNKGPCSSTSSACTVSSDCSSPPVELSSQFDSTNLTNTVGFNETMLGTSYLRPQRLHTGSMYHHSPSPEYVRRTRPQSPSPGRPINPTADPRQLPCGVVPQPKHTQQSHLVTQNSCKKTFEGIHNVASSPNVLENVSNQEVHEVRKESEVDLDPTIEGGGISSQANPLVMSVECILLPFLQNPQEVELRVPINSLSQAQRRLLKTMANENDLLLLSMPKTVVDPGMLVIRKRATLLQQQQVEHERKKREAEERARQRALEEEARLKRLREEEANAKPPVNTCCQTNLEQTDQPVGRKKYRRLRNERRRLARAAASNSKKKPKVVDCAIQTVPEDHWLCPWCLQHIAPEAQCGHEVICRAGVKQKEIQSELQARLTKRNMNAENRRRLRLGLPPLKKEKHQNDASVNEAISGRSRSRACMSAREAKIKKKSVTRTGSSNKTGKPLQQTTVVAKLDQVHPNDLNAMARLMQRVCSEPKCTRLADSGELNGLSIKCQDCHRIYCAQHRPVGLHAACAKLKPAEADTELSIACGMDADEKRDHLKAELRKRRLALMEKRQRV